MSYSRREFLSKVGMGATLLTLPSISTNANNLLSQDKKLGVALVGLGYYAEHKLAPALQQTQRCYLAGIVTGTPEKAEKWKQQYNLPNENIYNYQNFDNIINNKSIDVVYVVLPNSMHHEFTIRAAKAGKHVICEKPMCVSVKEAKEMIEACNKAKVRLFIGYRLHSEPFTQEAMKFRSQPDVGKIKFVQSEMGFNMGNPNQWRLKKSLAGGGAVMDVGVYAIQGARYSIGEEPISITAQEYKTDPVKFKEVDETVTFQMEFPGGAISSSNTSYASPLERLYIGAERGWLELKPAFGYGPLKGRTNKGDLTVPVVEHQVYQFEDFSKSIIENLKSDADGEEGLKDMKVIEALYRAIKSGKKEKIG